MFSMDYRLLARTRLVLISTTELRICSQKISVKYLYIKIFINRNNVAIIIMEIITMKIFNSSDDQSHLP